MLTTFKKPLIQTILKQAVFLILALFMFTVFINLSWFDEKLHPQLQALKTPQPVSLENNAYPRVWGLAAANDKDPYAVGRAIIDRLKEQYANGEKIEISSAEMVEMLGGESLDQSWQDQLPSLSCNTRIALDCAAKLMAEIQQLGTDNQRLNLILQRYEALLSQAHFQENHEGDAYTPLPNYSLLLRANRVFLGTKGLSDDPIHFIQAAKQDFQFWLTMLEEGEYLIAKMVALAGIRQNLQTASHLIRSNYFSIPQLRQLQRDYRPFTEAERDIGETFIAEMRLNIMTWEQQDLLYGDPSWIKKMFWQENATLNETYLKIYLPMQMLANLPAPVFYQREGFQAQPYYIRNFPPALYNLGGKLAIKESIGGFNIQDYISRVHDTDGQIAAVLLQIEIELSENSIPQSVVAQSNYRNPFTREPMEYDPQSNTVGFECLSPGQQSICQIKLGAD